MKRRRFIRVAAGASLVLGAGWPARGAARSAHAPQFDVSRVEARYYRKLPDREIECLLCPRLCRLGDKERGYCGVRENMGGTYYTLVYGKVCSFHVDPIEKKPFFHFLPGTSALSMATAGCNVNCKFCQNWEISQVRPEQVYHRIHDRYGRGGQKNGGPQRCRDRRSYQP
jgi:pyruvate formate lyase activating enzyme